LKEYRYKISEKSTLFELYFIQICLECLNDFEKCNTIYVTLSYVNIFNISEYIGKLTNKEIKAIFIYYN